LSSIPNIAGKISKLNETIAQKDTELADLHKSQEAVKYEIAKHIEKDIKHSIWSNYIDSLVEMYIKVRSIGNNGV
jgi:cell division protein FtsB